VGLGVSTRLLGLEPTPAFVSTPRELGLVFDGLALVAIRLLLGLSVIAMSASAPLLDWVTIGMDSQSGMPRRVADGPL
jgi:hypothetical protein